MEGRDVAPFTPRRASVPIRRRVARSGTRASLRFWNLVGLTPKSASTQIIARDDAPLDSSSSPPEPEPPPPVLCRDAPRGAKRRDDAPARLLQRPLRRAQPPRTQRRRPQLHLPRAFSFASPRAPHPRRDVPPARERAVTPSPPRSSQPSRPRPTPRASRPPRTRARLLPTLVPVSTRPTPPRSERGVAENGSDLVESRTPDLVESASQWWSTFQSSRDPLSRRSRRHFSCFGR